MPEENTTENPETNSEEVKTDAPETAPESSPAAAETAPEEVAPGTTVTSDHLEAQKAEAANDDVKVAAKAPELEPREVSASLTIEEQIEAWRDQANEVCIIINQKPGHQQHFERLFLLGL